MSAGWSRAAGVAVLSSLVASAAGVLLDGPLLWVCVALAALATALGSRAALAEIEPRGVPLRSLVLPAVGCVSTAGFARIAGTSDPVALLVAAVGGGLIVLLVLVAEGRVLSPLRRHGRESPGAVLPLTVVLAATGFVAIATAAPGGLTTRPASPLSEATAATIALADAALAFALGYRLSSLGAIAARHAVLAAGTFALSVGAAAGLARAWSLPGALVPVLLAAVFLLWAAYRAVAADERGRWHWVWEYAGLAGAVAVAVGWNLLLR